MKSGNEGKSQKAEEKLEPCQQWKKWVEEAEKGSRWWSLEAAFNVLEKLYALMDEQGLTTRQLGQKIGRSTRWVNRVFSADEKATIEEINEIAFGLGYKLKEISLEKVSNKE